MKGPEKNAVAASKVSLQELKQHFAQAREVLEWWDSKGFVMLESEGALTFVEWRELLHKAFEMFQEASGISSVNELFVRVCARGINDFGIFLTEEKKKGVRVEAFESKAREWLFTLWYQFHPARFKGEDAKWELLQRLAIIVREEHKSWLEALASQRYPGDEVSQKLWVDHYRGLL